MTEYTFDEVYNMNYGELVANFSLATEQRVAAESNATEKQLEKALKNEQRLHMEILNRYYVMEAKLREVNKLT